MLTGAGGHFCAGADLTGVEGDEFRAALRVLLDRLTTVPVPVIAAVEGAALGAGTQLAVACDLRVRDGRRPIRHTGGQAGLMVDHWTVQRLALLAGHGPAGPCCWRPRRSSGVTAATLGLVQRIGTLDDALALGRRRSRHWRRSRMAGHKLALNRLEPALADAEVDDAVRRAWASADVAEGMAAFRERRPPQFRGE